jgi:hypothetical protein
MEITLEQDIQEETKETLIDQSILEPKEEYKFTPTEEQIQAGRELTKELADLKLVNTHMSVDPSTSCLRFDVLTPNKKVYSIFIFPKGEVEYDLYTTKNMSESSLNIIKERDLIASKTTTIKELRRQLHFSVAN